MEEQMGTQKIKQKRRDGVTQHYHVATPAAAPTAAPVLKKAVKAIAKAPKYDAVTEVARFQVALSKGNSLVASYRRNRARRQLELTFGKIDWSMV
jgi:hypothetical protein